MVSHKILSDCRVKFDDITNSHAIFGINRSRLKGATVRQKPDRVDPEYTQIPRDFYELNKFVTLAADVMFVNDVHFLVTLSRDIRLFTAEFLPSCTAKQVSSLLNNIVTFYARGRFVVRLVLMDMNFEKIKDNIDKVEVKTTAGRKHVGEIERGIRLMKERSRCVISDLHEAGFKHFHKMIVVHCIYFICMVLNATPASQGTQKKISPRDCHR